MKKAIVLVCVLSLLAAAFVVAGCGSSGTSSGSTSTTTPEGVAKAFWTAAMQGDSAATWSMLSKQLQTGLKSEAEWAKTQKTSNPGTTVEAGKATVSGDTATVTVKILSGKTLITTSTVTLVKEGGVWKIELP